MTPEMCNQNKFDYYFLTLFIPDLEIYIGSGMSVGSCTLSYFSLSLSTVIGDCCFSNKMI